MLKELLKRKIVYIILIGVLALFLRLPGLGEFMTVDEENWMVRSAEFYDAIFAKNLGGTFMSTHPGATAMWLIGGGEVIQEKRMGFHVDQSNLSVFRKYATFPIVLTISILISISVFLLWIIFGKKVAIVSGLLLATDPYLLGLSQIAHLDALQGMLMLTALLSWIVYIKKTQKKFFIATIFLTGLALGTKMILAAWLFPVFALIIFTVKSRKKYWLSNLKALVLITIFSVVVLAIIWPAMLTKPDFQMGYIAKDTKTIVQDEHVSLSTSENPISPKTFYLRTVLGRTTPYTLLLTLSALIAVTYYSVRKKKVPDILWLILYSIGYLTLITLAAKKGDRYALPALVMFPVIAGWAAVTGWTVLRQKINLTKRTTVEIFLILALLVIAVPLLWYPHNIAYNNPFFKNVRPLSQQGWGEGLEEAAQWLNSHPLAEKMTIASWYPSVTATYFKGKTFNISSRNDLRVNYMVTYRNMGGRAGDTIASDVLDEMKKREPVHVVKINNVPYAWIYRKQSFSEITGELLPGVKVMQKIVPKYNEVAGLQLLVATYSGRAKSGYLKVVLREDNVTGKIMQVWKIPIKDIKDDEWLQLEFKRALNKKDQEFFVEVFAVGTKHKDAPTLRYSRDFDYRASNIVITRDGILAGVKNKKGDLAVQFIYKSKDGFVSEEEIKGR